ncbi:MAG: hypothetical protein IT198_05470 [Acidimicrobiia bacterium]|nr:hypothetical protein [Acidimicrobiia bacterium]
MQPEAGRQRVATIQLAESFLDELLRRTRRSPRFPASFSQRVALPAPAAGGAELNLDVRETNVQLRRGTRHRARIRVRMRGHILWDMALRQAAQNLEVEFTLSVRPEVGLDSSGSVRLGADFSRARVSEVSLQILDTPYVPVAAPMDLLGPFGRRVLDTVSREAIGLFVRSLGVRETDLLGPIGVWLGVLGADPAGSRVSVDDGRLVIDVYDAAAPQGTRREEVAPSLDPVHVSIDTRAAPRLLAHWAGELTREDPAVELDSTRFDFVGDEVVMSGRLRRVVPGLGRNRPVEADVNLRLKPECGPEHLTFAVGEVGVEWTSVRAARPVVQRLVQRWVSTRLRIPALWQLPVPFVTDRSWILGISDIAVADSAVEVALSAWFAPD